MPAASVKVSNIRVKEKLPIDAAIFVSEETRDATVRDEWHGILPGSKLVHESHPGEALERAAIAAFSQVFRSVAIVRTHEEAQKAFPIYIKPRLVSVKSYPSVYWLMNAFYVKVRVGVIVLEGSKELWQASLQTSQRSKAWFWPNAKAHEALGVAMAEAMGKGFGELAGFVAQHPAIQKFAMESSRALPAAVPTTP